MPTTLSLEPSPAAFQASGDAVLSHQLLSRSPAGGPAGSPPHDGEVDEWCPAVARVELALPAELLGMLDRLVVLLPSTNGRASAYRLLSESGQLGLRLEPQRERAQGDDWVERLRATFGVTRAEARVLAALADGQLPKRYALQNGLSVSTVRTQIAALMQKMDCCRQVDLVRKALQLGVSGMAAEGGPSRPVGRT